MKIPSPFSCFLLLALLLLPFLSQLLPCLPVDLTFEPFTRSKHRRQSHAACLLAAQPTDHRRDGGSDCHRIQSGGHLSIRTLPPVLTGYDLTSSALAWLKSPSSFCLAC